MNRKWLALAGAATLFATAGSAEAATYIATFSGTIADDGQGNDVIDIANVFGGGDITGKDFSLSFTSDFSAANLITDTATEIGVASPTPVRATLTIAGHSVAFDSLYAGQYVFANNDPDDGNVAFAVAVSGKNAGVLAELVATAPFLGSNFTTSTPYTVQSGDYMQGVFAIAENEGGDLNITKVSVTAAPEPATWALMIAGFGTIGMALRRRRQDRVAIA